MKIGGLRIYYRSESAFSFLRDLPRGWWWSPFLGLLAGLTFTLKTNSEFGGVIWLLLGAVASLCPGRSNIDVILWFLGGTLLAAYLAGPIDPLLSILTALPMLILLLFGVQLVCASLAWLCMKALGKEWRRPAAR